MRHWRSKHESYFICLGNRIHVICFQNHKKCYCCMERTVHDPSLPLNLRAWWCHLPQQWTKASRWFCFIKFEGSIEFDRLNFVFILWALTVHFTLKKSNALSQDWWIMYTIYELLRVTIGLILPAKSDPGASSGQPIFKISLKLTGSLSMHCQPVELNYLIHLVVLITCKA